MISPLNSDLTRRHFLQSALYTAGATAVLGTTKLTAFDETAKPKIRFGLVTYMWGADWDLPTLLTNLKDSGLGGVELRTTHKHGVEPSLNAEERATVKQRFADSGIIFVGPGSDERFDNPDPEVVKKAIARTKEFLTLSHDLGGTGVKVKPDRFYDNVPREKTIEQIGQSLNELGKFAADLGQKVRLEVHGQCSQLPTIRKIMDVADHKSVGICWNSNHPTDTEGEGLEANFRLVRERFGQTVHVRPLDDAVYPFAKLMQLLVDTKYEGWVLLEATNPPPDRVAGMRKQLELFRHMTGQ